MKINKLNMIKWLINIFITATIEVFKSIICESN